MGGGRTIRGMKDNNSPRMPSGGGGGGGELIT